MVGGGGFGEEEGGKGEEGKVREGRCRESWFGTFVLCLEIDDPGLVCVVSTNGVGGNGYVRCQGV